MPDHKENKQIAYVAKTQQTTINILSKWDEHKTNNTNKGIIIRIALSFTAKKLSSR